MRSILTLGAAALALAVAAPALAQTAAPGAAPAAAASEPAAPTGAQTPTSATAAAAPAPVAVGQPVKDNTGATIGSVTEVKPDAAGKTMATIKMGEKTFAVDTANLAVQDGATLINATQAELEGMLAAKK